MGEAASSLTKRIPRADGGNGSEYDGLIEKGIKECMEGVMLNDMYLTRWSH